MQNTYIVICYEDRQDIVQYAYDRVHAQTLIDTVMPKLRHGYYYKIITL